MQTTNLAADVVAAEFPTPPNQDTAISARPTVADGVVDLERIVETLAAQTSGADVAHVRSVVTEVARQFDNARVRSFLPLLIMKQAQRQLGSVGTLATS